jgi:hypothetical protein
MKQKRALSRILPLALAFSLLAAAQSQAAVVITNLQLTTTSISFDISGTMPTAVATNNLGTLFIVNPNLSASPGFALNVVGFSNATSSSFSGTQAMRSVAPPAYLGAPHFGDYAGFSLAADLAANETIIGTFTATWATPQMNPAAVTSLDFYWGTDPFGAPNSGTLLGNVAVPEPSGSALLLCSLAALAGRRRRR